jgi:hypothetical protein
MKKLLLGTLLFALTSGIAVADAFYTYIPYYNNDPFTFCTVGVPEDCWAPISKELGTFTVTNYYCYNAASSLLFAEVCPKAFPMDGGKSNVKASSATTTQNTRDPADASP